MKMNLLMTLVIAVLIGWMLTGPALAQTKTKKTNVVLIMADDMGFECVSANGNTPMYKTPRIDKMAAAGMRFVNCHSQPICTPSRVQIMTGIYNSRNYIKFGLLDPKATTFGHIMKKAGYATCVVGKCPQLRLG